MNDLELLRSLGDELDPAPLTPSAALDGQILRHFAGRPTRLRPWLLPVGASAAAAVLVIAVVTGISISGRTTPGPAAGDPPDARSVLAAAATAARSDPGGHQIPDPSSFVYLQTHESGYRTAHGVARPFDLIREQWLSVDGTHDGVMTPRAGATGQTVPPCLSGGSAVLPGLPSDPGTSGSGASGSGSSNRTSAAAGVGCADFPGYRDDIPTDAAGALKYLRHNGDPGRSGSDGKTFDAARQLLVESLLPADSQAAVLDAVATLPGLTVEPAVRTSSGAIATAVALVDSAQVRPELLFDPESHRVLGESDVTVTGADGLAANTPLLEVDLAQKTVVARLLLRPDGSVGPSPAAVAQESGAISVARGGSGTGRSGSKGSHR